MTQEMRQTVVELYGTANIRELAVERCPGLLPVWTRNIHPKSGLSLAVREIKCTSPSRLDCIKCWCKAVKRHQITDAGKTMVWGKVEN